MTSAVERSRKFSRVLGDEVRMLREQRGWTRKDLLRHAELDITLQTLATYELGTRQCTVVRLWELTEALEEPLEQFIVRVMQRIGEREVSGLVIDLQAAARTAVAGLGPLRAWARVELASRSDGRRAPVSSLNRAALDRLAELCRLDIVELVRRLQDRRAGLICSAR
jgi:transcriptional regulator with XRE-family HTH domain